MDPRTAFSIIELSTRPGKGKEMLTGTRILSWVAIFLAIPVTAGLLM